MLSPQNSGDSVLSLHIHYFQIHRFSKPNKALLTLKNYCFSQKYLHLNYLGKSPHFLDRLQFFLPQIAGDNMLNPEIRSLYA